MKYSHLQSLFDRLAVLFTWTDYEQWKDCPSHERLVTLAKDNAKSDHVDACERCLSIVELLRRANQPNSKLNSFILMTKELEKGSAKEQSASVWSYLSAFHSIQGTKWAFVSAAAAFLVLGATVWGLNGGYLFQYQNSKGATVSLGEDKYWYTVQLLRARTNELLESSFIPHDVRQPQMEEIQARATEVYRLPEGLEENQRGELGDLITMYQNAVIREALSGPPRELHQVTPVPNIVEASVSQDPDIVTTFYSRVGQAVSHKNRGSADKSPTQMEQAEAILAGANELKVKAIKKNEIVVLNIKADRNAAENDGLLRGIRMFEAEKSLHVNIIGTVPQITQRPGSPIPKF